MKKPILNKPNHAYSTMVEVFRDIENHRACFRSIQSEARIEITALQLFAYHSSKPFEN
jgi:hypothetical protein